METVPTYSLLIIFYMLLGALSGMANALIGHQRRGPPLTPPQILPLTFALIGVVYLILGLGEMRTGVPLYVYIPVVMMWWVGNYFGKTVVPAEWSMIGLNCAVFVGAIAIYHIGL